MPVEDQRKQRRRINWVAVTAIATLLALAIPGATYIFRSSEYLIGDAWIAATAVRLEYPYLHATGIMLE